MPLKIVSASAFEHKNLVAPAPVIHLVLDFDDLSDRSPAQLGPEFCEILRLFFSELAKNGAAADDDAKNFVATLGQDNSPRLGHIVARLALALQRAAGAEVSYAAVDLNIAGAPGRQQIIYAHWGKELGMTAGHNAFIALGQLLNLARAEKARTFSSTSAASPRQRLVELRQTVEMGDGVFVFRVEFSGAQLRRLAGKR